MNISGKNLGYREMHRLCSFTNLIIDNNKCDTDNSKICYDLNQDEPYILTPEFEIFYASELDIAFNSNDEACYCLPLENC